MIRSPLFTPRGNLFEKRLLILRPLIVTRSALDEFFEIKPLFEPPKRLAHNLRGTAVPACCDDVFQELYVMISKRNTGRSGSFHSCIVYQHSPERKPSEARS